MFPKCRRSWGESPPEPTGGNSYPRQYSSRTTITSGKANMKTIRKTIQETVDKILEDRGILAGDLSVAIADGIWTVIQERKTNKGAACPKDWMLALMRMCGANAYTASAALRAQISDCGKALVQADAEIGDLAEFAQWWKGYTAKWSVPHAYPTPKQIRDNWQKFLDTRLPQDNAIPSEQANFSVRL
jgi:hypothetical protein